MNTRLTIQIVGRVINPIQSYSPDLDALLTLKPCNKVFHAAHVFSAIVLLLQLWTFGQQSTDMLKGHSDINHCRCAVFGIEAVVGGVDRRHVAEFPQVARGQIGEYVESAGAGTVVACGS